LFNINAGFNNHICSFSDIYLGSISFGTFIRNNILGIFPKFQGK